MASVSGSEKCRDHFSEGDQCWATSEDWRNLSVEQIFDLTEVPRWTEQLTVRAFVVSCVLGLWLSLILMKLNLTSGIIPSFNVSAGLLGFFFVKTWATLLDKTGLLKQPFTRQENIVIQTCVVACSSISFSGGFGSYILGMSKQVANEFDEANDAINTKEPSLPWMILFLLVISFVGLFSVVPLRKIMIVGYKLTYPTGTAAAHIINSFHTPLGARLAKEQVSVLFKSFGASLFWSLFQWLYTAGKGCGFSNFPTFGLKAYQNSFYFDFSATYVGIGMICPYMISISLLLGSIISWGFLWPYISSKKGVWYDASLPASSLHGLSGYKVFIPIAMILGDGLSNFITVLVRTAYDIRQKRRQRESVLPEFREHMPEPVEIVMSYDDRRRTSVFLLDNIPTSIAVGGYLVLGTISVTVVPRIFPQVKGYHVAAAYLFAPFLAFCNAYGCGLTDFSLSSSYSKLAIFVFSAWIGAGSGGVLAGLVVGGVIMSVVCTSSDLMQDFKTGYLTLTSPRSMIISQVVGTAMGCVIAPTVFWVFYKASPLGVEGSQYPAPYAKVYRGIAMLGVHGVGALPKHCVRICVAFFAGAIAINVLREVAKHRNWWFHAYLPNAMGMAVPFYLGSCFAVDMCVGSLILYVWENVDRRHASVFVPAVASGLICGDGIWTLPSSMLTLWGVRPPMCLKFLSDKDNALADAVLGT